MTEIGVREMPEGIMVKNFPNLLTSNLRMNLSCSDNSKQSKYAVKPFTVQCWKPKIEKNLETVEKEGRMYREPR